MDPNILAVLGVLAGGGLISVFLRYRSENRSDDANAAANYANAAVDWQTVYEKTISQLEARVDELSRQVTDAAAERADLRDRARAAESSAKDAAREAATARTKQAEAQERVAELEAEIARLILESSEQRHALQNEIKARDLKIADLEHRFAVLNEQFETFRAQRGDLERRDSDRRA